MNVKQIEINKEELKQKIRIAIETLATGWHVDLELNDYAAELCDSMINSLRNLMQLYAAEVSREYKEALEKIAQPLKYLQKEADINNVVLDGNIAIRLANDQHWLRNIAIKTLKEQEEQK